MKNQRMMIFYPATDSAGILLKPSIGHQYCFDFSKKYILGKKLLNIGSWIGQYETLAVGYAARITSTDIEAKALAVLKKSHPRIICRKAFSHKLPFPDHSFDVVTIWAVIEHIPSGYELATLNEIKRVLKPGGYVFLSTMNKHILSDMLDPAYWLVGHRHYTGEQLTYMLNDAGFTVEVTEKHASWFTAIDAIIFYIFKHIFRTAKHNPAWLQDLIDRDYRSEGFYEIALRARLA